MIKSQQDRVTGYLLRVGTITNPDEFQDWYDRRTTTPAGKVRFKRVVAMSDTWWMGFFDGLKVGQQKTRRELGLPHQVEIAA